jgi:hypothetical protein
VVVDPPRPSDVPNQARASSGEKAEDQPRVHPEADAKQLVGWKEILPVLGRSPSSRADRELVAKLNQEADGPIKRLGKRNVIANHGQLLTWWKTAAERAEAKAKARAKADREDRVIDSSLSNPGVRKDEGFHAKERPNTRRRRPD